MTCDDVEAQNELASPNRMIFLVATQDQSCHLIYNTAHLSFTIDPL